MKDTEADRGNRGVLGGMSAEEFLRAYWQKKPLLLRQTYHKAVGRMDPDTLAGLACEPHVASRLVLEKGGSHPWQVKQGPFASRDLEKLGKKHWSLLVQAVDRRVADIAALWEDFCFIPNWRADDITISLAPDGGSVGPHVNHDDVFLVQIHGERRCAYSDTPVADNFYPDLELRILKKFHPVESHILKPGDVLYVPPRFAHHGVAMGDCMTLAVNFRAPDNLSLLDGFAAYATSREELQRSYLDPELKNEGDPGLMDATAAMALRDLVKGLLDRDDVWRDFLGRFLSTSRDGLLDEEEKAPSPDQLRHHFAKGGVLMRLEGGRFTYTNMPPRDTWLFVEGERFDLPLSHHGLAKLLCAESTLTQKNLGSWLQDDTSLRLIATLVGRDYLYKP